MSVFNAKSFLTQEPNSQQAAMELALALKETSDFGPLKAVIINNTVAHDHHQLLKTFIKEIGSEPKVIGCSVKGAITRGTFEETAFVASAIGLYGTGITACSALVGDIGTDSQKKGNELGKKILDQVDSPPKVAIVLYDPVSGVDVDGLVSGLHDTIPSLIVGGGAGGVFGSSAQTFQYQNETAFSHSAVVLTLSGKLDAVVDYCHACEPTGIPLTITRSEGPLVLEIEGKPALEAWKEMTGSDLTTDLSAISYWMLGLEETIPGNSQNHEESKKMFVRGFVGIDKEKKAFRLLSPLPSGTEIELYQQSVEAARQGLTDMCFRMKKSLKDRKPVAAFAFECNGRAEILLGADLALQEVLVLQEELGEAFPWWGMLSRGEIAPVNKKPRSHNFTFPVLLLTNEED